MQIREADSAYKVLDANLQLRMIMQRRGINNEENQWNTMSSNRGLQTFSRRTFLINSVA